MYNIKNLIIQPADNFIHPPVKTALDFFSRDIHFIRSNTPICLSYQNKELTMPKTLKQVCECKNCGNESEMTITCSLEEVAEPEVEKKNEVKPAAPHTKKVKGSAVCSHCGNEADMWVDLPE
jgi:hypothetical protein